jgi:hypothetical protein
MLAKGKLEDENPIMKHKTMGALLGVLLTGCGDGSLPGEDVCAAPEGDFALTFWPVSGTCPLLNAVVAPGGKPPVTGCEGGSETWSADRCTATYRGRCPSQPPYAEAELEIIVRWAPDGRSARGDAEVSAFYEDGSLGCSGTYEIQMGPYTARSLGPPQPDRPFVLVFVP